MRKTKKMVGTGLAIGLAGVLFGGCATTTNVAQQLDAPTEKVVAASAAKAEAVPQKIEPAAVAAKQPFLSGKVTETMNSGGYTYVQLEKEGEKAWFAIPTTSISVGQELEFRPGVQMGLFKSRTLNKSFDSIVFAPGLVVDPNASLPAAAPPAVVNQNAMPSGHPSLNADPKAYEGKATKDQLHKVGIGVISGKVVETMNSGGYTYILIANGAQNIWGAVPTTNVAVGQELELLPGQTMTNFNSKSLNRKFDSVIFSTGVVPITK